MTATEGPTEREDRPGFAVRDIALVAVAAPVMLFSIGVVAGAIAGAVEKGGDHSPWLAPVILAALVLAGGALWLLIRTVPRLLKTDYPLSPRTGKARSMLYLSMAIGAVLGAVISFGSLGDDPRTLWSGPIAPGIALFAIAVWIIAVPLMSWRWWRNIDEHEALAYKDGALAGIYAYSFVAPSWWMGWRGGFLPEPQEMITFLVVIAVWGLVWAFRRYG